MESPAGDWVWTESILSTWSGWVAECGSRGSDGGPKVSDMYMSLAARDGRIE